jgi:Domain of unknown function (DUF4397)
MKVVGAALALTLGLGCGGGRTDRAVVTRADDKSSVSPAGTDVANRGKSLVRLVNALSLGKRIDVSGDDRTVFTNVEYRAVTAYHEIGDNLVTFRLRAAGGDSVLGDNTQAMADGSRYTIVAMPGVHGDPVLLFLRDEVVPDAGKARIRVINAAPDIGTVDVAFLGEKLPLFGGVKYASEAGYKDIAPGTMTIDIRSDLKTRKPIQLKDRRFEAGKAYTIVLAGWGTSGIDSITFDDTEAGRPIALGRTR